MRGAAISRKYPERQPQGLRCWWWNMGHWQASSSQGVFTLPACQAHHGERQAAPLITGCSRAPKPCPFPPSHGLFSAFAHQVLKGPQIPQQAGGQTGNRTIPSPTASER